MKRRGLLPNIAWVLLGLLVLGAVMITLGQRERFANPRPDSYAPSGTRAFVDLLKKLDVPVTVSGSARPVVSSKDVLMGIYPDGFVPSLNDKEKLEKTIDEYTRKHLLNGGTVVTLPIESEFRDSSLVALKAPTAAKDRVTGKELQVFQTPAGLPLAFQAFDSSTPTYSLYQRADGGSLVTLGKVHKGTVLSFSDGIIATNRFIDRGQNAEVLLSSIKRVIPEGGRLVLMEATITGEATGSLLGTIGPWAEAAWTQILVLFVVIVVTLGYRFGIAESARRAERGQRELLEAISDTYRRAKMTGVALDSAYKDADARIRRALKIPMGASVKDRDALIPPKLASTLHTVREQALLAPRPIQALKLMAQLEGEMHAMLGSKTTLEAKRAEQE